METTLHVNHKTHRVQVRPDEFLLDTLRGLGYHSVKCGCDTTACGLCTVLVDGLPLLSCSLLTVRAEGKAIETLEGLESESAPLRELIASEGGDQCGFCAPGFLVNAVALKRSGKKLTDSELAKYFSGNLCRCTGYASQMRAVKVFLEG